MISIRSLIFITSICLSINAYSENGKDSVVIIEPNKSVTNVQAAAIDTEHFEVGAYFGTVSVEELNTNLLTGLSLTYHINTTWLAQAHYARSKISRAAFEETSGFTFLSADDLNYEYIRLMGGYKLFEGRSFLGKRHKYNSAIYLLGGISDVNFAGSRNQGISFGLSYRTVITDWLTVNLDFNNTNVDLKLFNDKKRANNTELSFGVNALF